MKPHRTGSAASRLTQVGRALRSRVLTSVDEHGDVVLPAWRWRWAKRRHNLTCSTCRPLYTRWSLRVKKPLPDPR